MLETRSKIWWNDITGPARLVSDIAAGLLDGKNVVVLVPEDLPWRHDMRATVEGILRDSDYELDVQFLDCKDKEEFFSTKQTRIAEYLLSLADPDIQNGYRSTGRYTVQKYLLDNQVLLKKVLWVKGMSQRQASDWLVFCKDYKAQSRYDGLFVLESYDEMSLRGIGNSVLILRYEQYVSFYDALLFDNMLVSSLELSMEWKQYIAAVMASLCGCDVQLAQSLLDYFEKCRSPIECLQSISEGFEYEARMKAVNLTADHPFSIIKSGMEEKLHKKLWNAQLQILFPLIEIERIAMIDRYQEKITEALSTAYMNFNKGYSATITQFGEPIAEPYQTELGTVYRMTCLRKASDPEQYLLYLPKEEDRERLTLLHRMRNSIAHGKACDNADAVAFLDGYPHQW